MHHEYRTTHAGDLILFNLEDYQPYEPENCLYESYYFSDIVIGGKEVDYEDLTSREYAAMVEAVEEGAQL